MKEDEFADVHLVSTYIRRRLEVLATDEPLGEQKLRLGRAERDAIIEFVMSRRGEVGELRVRTLLAWLPVAASRLGPEFLRPGRGTPATFRASFEDYARSTKETVATCLGSFWRWWFDKKNEDVPRWLRIRLEKWEPTNGASDMLTRDEISQIVENALNFRDRAWIWTLFNSGCRPGEIYRLRVGDVVPHDEGYIELRVNREKGSAPEPAPVYEDAVPALLAWLAAHPRADDPRSPLWVDIGGARTGQVASYRAMLKALQTASARAKVTKPVTAYALRRSRLTMLAKDPAVSTSILERVAGWVPGSRVAQHYVHLSGKDVIAALNTRYGVKSPDPPEKQATPRTPARCGRCKTVNPAGAAYCMTCGGPLSLPAVKQIEEARTAEERLAHLLQDPEVVEILANRLAQQDRKGAASNRQAGRSAAAPPELKTPQPTRQSSPQEVVPLAEAEQLIRAGYEYVATLGTNRAILRPPQSSFGRAPAGGP